MVAGWGVCCCRRGVGCGAVAGVCGVRSQGCVAVVSAICTDRTDCGRLQQGCCRRLLPACCRRLLPVRVAGACCRGGGFDGLDVAAVPRWPVVPAKLLRSVRRAHVFASWGKLLRGGARSSGRRPVSSGGASCCRSATGSGWVRLWPQFRHEFGTKKPAGSAGLGECRRGGARRSIGTVHRCRVSGDTGCEEGVRGGSRRAQSSAPGCRGP